MSNGKRQTRRFFLRLVGTSTMISIAGCSENSGENNSESVPEEYQTATSIGGQKRDPDQLQSKQEVQYQTEPRNNNQCSGCTYYIEDKNGDGEGACTLVEGKIQPNAWCASYAPYEE